MVIVVKWLSHVNGCGCRFGLNGDKMQKKHSRVIYGVDAAVVGSSNHHSKKKCDIIDQSNAPISDRV